MKKIAIILILISGIFLVEACKKAETDPKLDVSQSVTPTITSPADGSSFVLTKENAGEEIKIVWTAATYNLDDLASTSYLLQLLFNHPEDGDMAVDLISTPDLSYTTTKGALNAALLAAGMEGGTEVSAEFKVSASLKSYDDGKTIQSTVLGSSPVSATIVPYENKLVYLPIYMLGSGTSVGWDNAAALEMPHLGEGLFARVETLTAGADQFVKFISDLGAWAPQWGTDDTGTSEDGPLVYRPTEDVPDPSGIPVGDLSGPYYVEADTALLTYNIYLTSGELFLVGDASNAGWDAGNGIQFTEDPAHVFTLTTDLKAEGGMKFLEVSGSWAPQWGTNETGTGESGMLVYRPTESTPDPSNIPAPAVAGSYTIVVDMTTMMYTITAN